jgi:ABC-type oligopeptide transport system substrate-binding subunit
MAPEKILAEFRAWRLSLAADLYPADVEALRREAAFAGGYRETPRLSIYYAVFNIHRGPLQDREVRRRLAGALDRTRLVKETLGTLAVPAQGLIPPGLLDLGPLRAARESAVARPVSNTAELQLTATFHPVFRLEYSGFAQELVKSLRAVGIELQVVKTETTAESLELMKKGSIDLALGRWIADYPDADTFAYILHSPDGSLGKMCGTPELDRLIARGRTETFSSARHAIYREIEEIIAREALLVPLFHEQVYRFTRPDLQGLSLSYWLPAVTYENLSLHEPR